MLDRPCTDGFPSLSAAATEVTVPLLRRGSLTAPARRNTIAADQGVASMAKIGYPVPQQRRPSDWTGTAPYVAFDTEADINYLLEVVEPPKRRREPKLVIPSPVLGAG
jgi:hypothetical protein